MPTYADNLDGIAYDQNRYNAFTSREERIAHEIEHKVFNLFEVFVEYYDLEYCKRESDLPPLLPDSDYHQHSVSFNAERLWKLWPD